MKINETEKRVDFAHCLEDRPGVQDTGFTRIRRNASGVDEVPKIQYFIFEQLALGVLEFEASDADMLEDSS